MQHARNSWKICQDVGPSMPKSQGIKRILHFHFHFNFNINFYETCYLIIKGLIHMFLNWFCQILYLIIMTTHVNS